MQLPQEVREILLRLEQAGHRGWAVGGCVRDLLRGQTPHDWDLCTDALPEQTIAAFRGEPVAAPGLAHGTVTLVRQGVPYEITPCAPRRAMPTAAIPTGWNSSLSWKRISPAATSPSMRWRWTAPGR